MHFARILFYPWFRGPQMVYSDCPAVRHVQPCI